MADVSRDIDDLLALDTPLVVYAGPELSRLAGLPDDRALVDRLLHKAEDYLSARQHRELSALADGPALDEVFGELERALSPPPFGNIIERALDDGGTGELPELACALAELAPRLRGVITPNLDLVLERAFAGQLAVHAQPKANLAARRGWLLKIRGTLHDRSSWILTREQRSRALHRDPVHRELFRSLFFSHPILFVATPLDDPLLTELVDEARALAHGQPPRHWAFVNAEDAGPINQRKFAAAGIHLIGYDNPKGDLAGCTALVRALAGSSVPPGPETTRSVSTPTPPPKPTPNTSAAEPPPSPNIAARPVESVSVLFIAANPSDTDPLRIDRELRIIRGAIERSRHRDRLELDVRTAATVHDLRRAMLDRDYTIVHLSGHGEREGLLLEDDNGNVVEVPRSAIARFFGRCAARGSLRCVLLNACWSSQIGEQPGMSVPYTVVMDGPISDLAALEYSRGFYDALGAGLDVEVAHEEGLTCVDLAAHGAKFDCRLLSE